MSTLGNFNFIDLPALLILVVIIFNGAIRASAVLEGTPTADNLTGTSSDDFLSGGGPQIVSMAAMEMMNLMAVKAQTL